MTTGNIDWSVSKITCATIFRVVGQYRKTCLVIIKYETTNIWLNKFVKCFER